MWLFLSCVLNFILLLYQSECLKNLSFQIKTFYLVMSYLTFWSKINTAINKSVYKILCAKTLGKLNQEDINSHQNFYQVYKKPRAARKVTTSCGCFLAACDSIWCWTIVLIILIQNYITVDSLESTILKYTYVNNKN